MSLFSINRLIDQRQRDPQAGSRACHSDSAWELGRGKGFILCFYLNAGAPTRVGCGRGIGLTVLSCSGCSLCCIYSSLGSVQVGLFLKLADIFLVPDALVAKPVGYLCREEQEKEEEQRSQMSNSHSSMHWTVELFQDVMFGSIKYPIPSPYSNVHRVHKLIKS